MTCETVPTRERVDMRSVEAVFIIDGKRAVGARDEHAGGVGPVGSALVLQRPVCGQ
jgi:hypothetical protein